MEYLLYQAWSAGMQRLVVVTRADLVAEVRERLARRFPAWGRGWEGVGEGGASPMIDVVEQPGGIRGTVPAVLAARRILVGDYLFGVANADDLYSLAALRALCSWDGAGHAVVGFRLAQTMLHQSRVVHRALCRTQLPSRPRHGELELVTLAEAAVSGPTRSADGRDERWFASELGATKGEFSVPGTQLVSMNLWALRSTIWPFFDEAVKEYRPSADPPEVLLPVVMGELVARRQAQVHVLPVEGRCVGLTWPEELATVRALVADMVAAGELPATAAFEATAQL